MKAAPFAYEAPETVEEALALLARGDGAVVLAGGQSLVQQLNMRARRPSLVVDVNGIPGLDAIEEDAGELRIGALARQQALLDHEGAQLAHPLLSLAGRHAGYRATRNRGTVGGSLAFAAPWAELTAAAVALDARVEVRSTRGARTIPARELFRGPHETALEPDELLTRVEVPAAAPRTGAGFHEASPRYRDYAHVAAAATVTLDQAGRCSAAELVVLRVAPTPYRADTSALVGSTLDEEALESALAQLRELDPPGDIEVSGAYRRRVAIALARRALRDAAGRAREAA